MKYCVEDRGRKHHALLHLENQIQASVNSTKYRNSTNKDSVRTFLQIIPVKVKHGTNTTVVKALLDSGSYTTLITTDLAKALKLKGELQTFNIIDAISSLVSVTSKLVESTISSNHYPEQTEVKNAWVV